MNKITLFLSLIIISIIFAGCIYILGEPDVKPYSQVNHKKWKEQRQNYVKQHPELSDRQRNLILAGITDKSLTKNQIINVMDWGKPDSVEPTTKYGADEVWIYKKRFFFDSNTRLYFKGDILVEFFSYKHKRGSPIDINVKPKQTNPS